MLRISAVEPNKMIKLLGSNDGHVNIALAIPNGTICEKGV